MNPVTGGAVYQEGRSKAYLDCVWSLPVPHHSLNMALEFKSVPTEGITGDCPHNVCHLSKGYPSITVDCVFIVALAGWPVIQLHQGPTSEGPIITSAYSLSDIMILQPNEGFTAEEGLYIRLRAHYDSDKYITFLYSPFKVLTHNIEDLKGKVIMQILCLQLSMTSRLKIFIDRFSVLFVQ